MPRPECCDSYNPTQWGRRIVVETTTSHIPTDVVLKASAEYDVHLEAGVIRQVKAAGVCVPAILAKGSDERLPGQAWFVMAKASGQPWNTLNQSAIQRAPTLEDLGYDFAKIHAIQRNAWGPPINDRYELYNAIRNAFWCLREVPAWISD